MIMELVKPFLSDFKKKMVLKIDFYHYSTFLFSHQKWLAIRGHSTTTWTEFFDPPPLRGQFYTLSVDENRHILTPSLLILST
jgi:hypothetical protein